MEYDDLNDYAAEAQHFADQASEKYIRDLMDDIVHFAEAARDAPDLEESRNQLLFISNNLKAALDELNALLDDN